MAAQVSSSTAKELIARYILQQVPGCEPPHEFKISPLGGVRNNRVFKIETRAGRFVLRLQGKQNNQPAVDRRREQTLHSLAATAGLAPRVLACDPQAGWLVMEYVEGRLWTAQDFTHLAKLASLGERLHALHSLPAPALPAFNPLQVMELQAASIVREDPEQAPEVKRVVAHAHQLARDLSALPRRIAIAHGDLDGGNLIGEPPIFIDWEYAQLTDPVYDIACLLTYYPQARKHGETLLTAAGLADALSKEILQTQLRMFEALNDLWHRTQRLKDH